MLNKFFLLLSILIISEISFADNDAGGHLPATPVPEPEIITLLAIGANALAWARNKK